MGAVDLKRRMWFDRGIGVGGYWIRDGWYGYKFETILRRIAKLKHPVPDVDAVNCGPWTSTDADSPEIAEDA